MVPFRRLLCRTMANKFTRNDKKYSDSIVYSDNFTVEQNIDYNGDGDYAHKLDLLRPKDNQTKLPLIVHIHGGGFFYGSKDIFYKYYGVLLTQGGVAVANINYPLLPDCTYDQLLFSCAEAINFLYRNADKYNIDGDRIFLAGDSAGANICAQMAVIATNPTVANGLGIALDAKISAIKLSHGLYDADLLTKQRSMSYLYKCMYDSNNYKKMPSYRYASPIRYVTQSFPPTFVVSSLADPLCPQSLALSQVLKEKNIPNVCEFLPKQLGLPHVFDVKEDNAYAPQVRADMFEFFRKYL